MACKQYILTNTTGSNKYFNYRRCEDSIFESQVLLEPGQTKTIWLVDNSYSTAFNSGILLVDVGTFPPISNFTPTPTPTKTATPTPTPTKTLTPTPTSTPTNTPTPSSTSTPTPTPTSTTTPTMTVTQTSSFKSFTVTTGSTSNEACGSVNSITLYGTDALFDQNTQFYNEPSGVVTIDLAGYYSYGGQVVQLTSGGAETGGFSLCSVLPTATPTMTPTLTSTPTPTVTLTMTPTQTFSWYTYTLGTGLTANDACLAFTGSPQTIYGAVAGGIGPNVGEYLYETAGIPLTDAVPDGYYSNGVAWFRVTGGLGQITSSDPNGC